MYLVVRFRDLITSHLAKVTNAILVGVFVWAASYHRGPAQPFSQIDVTLPTVFSTSVAFGDFDNDGKIDTLASGLNMNLIGTSKVFRNVGGGSFIDLGADIPAISYGSAEWIDYNNDGLLDIFLTGLTSNNGQIVKIFQNQGNGSFVDAQANLPQGSIFISTAWGDFDNDGDIDLLIGTGELYRNDGNGNFTRISPGWSTFINGSAAWGDFDNDGDLDVLIAGQNCSVPTEVITKVYRNDGDGVFEDAGTSLPGSQSGGVAWGDYDADGKLDFFLGGVVSAGQSAMVSKVFHNDGNGFFSDSGFVLSTNGSATWVDYNNDGYQDLCLIRMYPAQAQLYWNAGGTNLINSGITFDGFGGGWCDFDADDDLDLFLSASQIERNDISIANSKPAAPAGLQATVSGRSTTLSWNPATDINQSGRLTYNLRIGTAPGGVDIVSPGSDPNSGFRRIPRSGNVQHNLSWSIHNLAVGNYYWSVQAVDTSFAGSVFASEGTFSVTLATTAPAVVTDPATAIFVFAANANGLVYPNGLNTQVYFEFGTNTEYGSATTPQQFPATLAFTNVSQNLSNLVQGTVYHYRIVATNDQGITRGQDQTFKTLNFNPNISNIPDMEFAVTELTLSTNILISDPESPADQLVLEARSSNTNFVRTEDIFSSGSGSNRTVTFTRIPNQIGDTTITITVIDPQGATRSDTFLLGVDYFTPIASLRSGGYSAAFGDYDGEGDLDILKDTLHNLIYRNDGNLTFSNIPPASSVASGEVLWGDYDNDGDLDILTTGTYRIDASTYTKLYRNNGGGSFSTNTLSGISSVGAEIASSVDFDNDGRLDIFLAGKIYRNNGDQTFSSIVTNLPRVAISTDSMDWGDYDNDGRLDCIMSGYGGTAFTRVYHNNGDNTFTDINAALPIIQAGEVRWGDYNNDGQLDFLVTGNGPTGIGITRVYRNNGNGTFTYIPTGLPGVSPSAAAWGDLNNDGYLDIVLTSRVYLNNRNGNFFDLSAGLSPIVGGFVRLGDFDADGDLDILLGWDGPNRLYQNNSAVSNTPPTAPGNLLATILPHNNVILGWDPATDTETTNSKGLYYNLRVGTTPGGMQLFSPHADLATGRRRIPGFGNAGHTNRWLVANLPQGTYYWSVQTIDTSFAGSPFASESSFTITNALDLASNHPPVAISQSVSLDEDTSLPITLAGLDADGDPLTYILATFPTNGVLVGIAPNLTYVPNTDYFGPDSFQFRVRDGLAVSTNVNIGITIAPVPDVAELRVSQMTSGSYCEIIITGEPYQSYALEASTNLVDWITLYSYKNRFSVNAYSPSLAGYPQRYFRARALP